jgi:hypothetical protein
MMTMLEKCLRTNEEITESLRVKIDDAVTVTNHKEFERIIASRDIYANLEHRGFGST